MLSHTPIGFGNGQRPGQVPQSPGRHDNQGRVNAVPGGAVDGTDSLATSSPQQILNQQILATLNRHLEIGGAQKIESLTPEEFTPEKVAERILGFIGSSINLARANGADEEKLQQMMVQAREGVERGFNEAREILQGLGLFDGAIKQNADQTFDLLQQGLDRLQGKTPEASQQLAMSASARQSRTLSLEIRTQDGDLITLTMESMRARSQDISAEQDSRSARFSVSQQTESSSSLNYRIEGDLDQGERQALGALVDDIGKVADKFYAGDIDRALSQAGRLGFDQSEIAAFSVSMGQVETRQASIAYQRVEQLGQGAGEAAGASGRELSSLSRFMPEFADLLAQFRESPLFAEPDQTLQELFGQRLTLDPRSYQADEGPQDGQPPEFSAALEQLMGIAGQMLQEG